jgi:hypothetical protein
MDLGLHLGGGQGGGSAAMPTAAAAAAGDQTTWVDASGFFFSVCAGSSSHPFSFPFYCSLFFPHFLWGGHPHMYTHDRHVFVVCTCELGFGETRSEFSG